MQYYSQLRICINTEVMMLWQLFSLYLGLRHKMCTKCFAVSQNTKLQFHSHITASWTKCDPNLSREPLGSASSETTTSSFIDLVLILINSLSCSVSCWWKFPDHCTLKYQPVCSCLCCIKKRSLSICCLYILYMPDSSMKATTVQPGSGTTVNQ